MASRCWSASSVPCDSEYAYTPRTTPRTIMATPRRSNCRSRAVEGSRSRIAEISDLSCSTRSGVASMAVLILSSSEICRAQLARDVVRLALQGNATVRHDRGFIRHAEHDFGELLDDENRDSLSSDARHVLVQLL